MNQFFIGTNLLQQLAAYVRPLGSRFALITDTQVEKLFARRVKEALENAGLKVDCFAFPAGEASKTRETKAQLEDALFAAGFGKDSCILAIGGGVVSDLAGFVASTFCRGVPLILVPTTLLAMADAAIGGKNGVNLPYGKNLIGTFYFPKAIFMDLSSLETLPEKELRSGSAEIIKHALIADASLFAHLEKGSLKDPTFLEEALRKSSAIKRAIAEKDPTEQGLRCILNFGHTIGHALETLLHYQISHGDAVAFGIYLESLLSFQLGHLKQNDVARIRTLLEAYGFSLKFPPQITLEQLQEAMKRDKKSKHAQPRFVLLKKIGEALAFEGEYCSPVADKILQEAYEAL